MAAFSITSASPSAALPITRRGRVEFTVTNTARRDLTARAHVVTEGSARAGWFTIVGPQRDSPHDSTHHYGVQVAVPIDAPSGQYRFRLDVVAVEDPDEYEGEGVWATVDVPPAPQPRRIPLWLIALAALLLIAIAVAVYLLFIRTPPKAKLDVSATLTTFGNIPVGQGSPGSVVTIKNTGGAEAKVTATLTGLNPGDFKILATTCADVLLKSDSTCQLQIGFQPGAQGARAATLTVGAPNAEAAVTLPLSGNGQGAAAAVVFTPASVVLKATGADPPASVVTIKNNGGTPVKIANIKLDDPQNQFHLVSDCEGVTLAGGQTCQVVVVYTRTTVSTTPDNARLLVSDDAPGSPQVVPLSAVRTVR